VPLLKYISIKLYYENITKIKPLAKCGLCLILTDNKMGMKAYVRISTLCYWQSVLCKLLPNC